MLTVKLEEFVDNAKKKRTSKSELRNQEVEEDEVIKEKESKLKKA